MMWLSKESEKKTHLLDYFGILEMISFLSSYLFKREFAAISDESTRNYRKQGDLRLKVTKLE